MTGGGRPFDALYDTSYKVSGARDHYREQNRNAGIVLEKLPEYNNMFSKLPHHPSTTYRFKPNDNIPPFVNREHIETQPSQAELKSISTSDVVSGPNRFKYVKRPLLGTGSAVPTNLAMASASGAGERPPEEDMPRSRTVGTQSLYRESEAQTIPYSPDYVIPEEVGEKQATLMEKYNTDVPEILTLQKLKFANGLPPGLNELNHIDKLREKRAFEASLPPLHDTEQLPRRRAMMDAWEEKEWAERDREIEGLQEERLGILANALEVREANIESMAYDRVDGYREREEAKREKVYAAIQKRRIKAVRHLTTARKMADSTLKEKKTIIQKYGDFGSDVYAPLQRAGRFPDSKPAGKEINPDQFTPKTLHGIYDLENSVPERKLEPRIKPPKNNQRLDANGRKDRAIGMDLDHIDSLLESTKAQGGRGFGDCWPYPLATDAKIKKDKRQRNIVERPSTPVAPPVPVSAKRHAAATLLQRLLRGRAVQNIMYEGKTRRLELIQELRLEETAQQREAELLQTARSSAVAVGRADTAPRTLPLPGVLQVQDAVVDDIVGAAIVEVMNVLTMEPGEEQTSMLRELMTKYAPPAADDVDADEAATKIQSVFRGHQARQSIDSEEKRQAQAEQQTEEPIRYSADQEAAAVKIQARTRGMLTRKHQKTTKTSKTSKTSKTTKTTKTNKQTKKSNITTRRHQLSPEQVEELGDVDEDAVVKMQAQSRGFLARKKVQVAKAAKAKYGEDEDKIVKIQAQGRKYLAKKRVAAMRNPEGPSKDDGEEEEAEGGSSSSSSASSSDGEQQEVGEAGADADDNGEDAKLPDLNQFSEEEQQKIVKMQAQGRGYIARKQLKAKKEGGPGSEAAGSADIADPGADDSAGEGIASAVAAADEELPDLSQFSEAEQQKIVKMQAQSRGYIARKQVKAKKDGGAADGAAGSAAAAEQPDMGSASDAPAADPGADAGESGAGEDGGNADAPAAPAGDGMAAELPDLSQFSEEEQQKIVKMQAQGRGYIARKQVKAKKEGSLGEAAASSTSQADEATASAEAAAQAGATAQPADDVAAAPEAAAGDVASSSPPAGDAPGIGAGEADAEPTVVDEDGFPAPAPAAADTPAASADAGNAAAADQTDASAAADSAVAGDSAPDAPEQLEAAAAAADVGAGEVAPEGEPAGESVAAAPGPDGEGDAMGGVDDAAAADPSDGQIVSQPELPDLSKFTDEEQQKVVKMQAQGRGYITRKHMKEQQQSATSFTTVQTRADTNVAARTSEHRSESSEMHHRSSTTQQSRTETSSTQQQTFSSSSTSVETSSTKVEMTSSAQVFSTSSTVETSSSAQMHHSSSTEVRVEHSSSAQKSEITTSRSESAAAVNSTAEVSEVADAAVAE